jgi:hypothetical protein
MNKKYKITALCALLFATNTYAQDNDLSRELTIEREYNPSVGNANKINTLPEVKEPVITKRTIDYANQTFLLAPPKEITTLSSGKVMTDILYSKKRGYLNLGAGMGVNINGDFGYHILSTDKNKLNIFLSHRSTNGKRKYLQSDEKWDAKLNDNIGGINFKHDFGSAAFTIGAQYGYSAFNYFGYPVVHLASSIMPNFDRDTEQVNQNITVNTGVQSKKDADIYYSLNLGYTNFSQKYGFSKDIDGVTENTFSVNGELNVAVSDNQRLGGEVIFTNLSSDSDHTAITLSPYYKIKGDSWNVKLGANIMYVNEYSDNEFVLSPNIAADVEVANKTVLYANAGGSIQNNSMYEVSRINRYARPGANAIASQTWLDATAGLKTGALDGAWFHIFGGYKATDNDMIFTPGSAPSIANGFGNYGITEIFDTKKFYAGAEVKYNYQSLFGISLKGVFNNWDAKNVYGRSEAYGRPKTEITSTIDVSPIDKFTVSAKCYLATGRVWTPGYSYEDKAKNINELNVTGTYIANETFGAYVQLNNLLSQKYDLWYGYPAQGFNAMVGININF